MADNRIMKGGWSRRDLTFNCLWGSLRKQKEWTVGWTSRNTSWNHTSQRACEGSCSHLWTEPCRLLKFGYCWMRSLGFCCWPQKTLILAHRHCWMGDLPVFCARFPSLLVSFFLVFCLGTQGSCRSQVANEPSRITLQVSSHCCVVRHTGMGYECWE